MLSLGWPQSGLGGGRAATPSPGAGTGSAAPELAVLAVLTGALDLSQESARQLILANLATLDDARLTIYTVLVLNAVAGPARQALEAMMTTARFRNDFVDRILAEGEAKGLAEGEAKGKAEGEARMILRVLAARGLDVSGDVRERVMACSDLRQLEIWGDRAATAANIEDVFG
jgi:predicted transposase YdaD